MLGRYDDLCSTHRFSVLVANSDLALRVRLEVAELAGTALLGKDLEDLVAEINRRGHERVLLVHFALGAGEAEHHALIAGAFLALLVLVDAHGDVGRLAVEFDLDIRAVPGEAILVVADVLDHAAGDLGDQFAVDLGVLAPLVEQRSLAAAFASDHDLVRGAESFAAQARIDEAVVGNAQLDVVAEKFVEDGIRNLVADLVGVAF